MFDLQPWKEYVAGLPVRPKFVTISGAHLYGFPSPDSDVDLRGCHQLPLPDVVGLKAPKETFERSGMHTGVEVDLVSHDLGKYLRLMVRNNGYILEQIFSPLVVCGQEFLDQLRPLAARCITRFHFHHYRGFAVSQRKLLDKQNPKRAKTLLYAYRVLLTGIHLLRSGQVEPNVVTLNAEFKLPGIDELIAAKNTELAAVEIDWPFHAAQLDELEARMQREFDACTLPTERDYQGVHDFLVEQRIGSAV